MQVFVERKGGKGNESRKWAVSSQGSLVNALIQKIQTSKNSCRVGEKQVQDRLHHTSPKCQWTAGALYSWGVPFCGGGGGAISIHACGKPLPCASVPVLIAIPQQKAFEISRGATLRHALTVSPALDCTGPRPWARNGCKINWHRLSHAVWSSAGMRETHLKSFRPTACDGWMTLVPKHFGKGLQQEVCSEPTPSYDLIRVQELQVRVVSLARARGPAQAVDPLEKGKAFISWTNHKLVTL